MVAKGDLDYDILIEAKDAKNIDKYYKILKKHKWHDFVDDFIVPEWSIQGVRIDTELRYPMTIKTKQITCENMPSLLGQIKSIREMSSNDLFPPKF